MIKSFHQKKISNDTFSPTAKLGSKKNEQNNFVQKQQPQSEKKYHPPSQSKKRFRSFSYSHSRSPQSTSTTQVKRAPNHIKKDPSKFGPSRPKDVLKNKQSISSNFENKKNKNKNSNSISTQNAVKAESNLKPKQDSSINENFNQSSQNYSNNNKNSFLKQDPTHDIKKENKKKKKSPHELEKTNSDNTAATYAEIAQPENEEEKQDEVMGVQQDLVNNFAKMGEEKCIKSESNYCFFFSNLLGRKN